MSNVEKEAALRAAGFTQSEAQPYIWDRKGVYTVHLYSDGHWACYGYGERCKKAGKLLSGLTIWLNSILTKD